MEVTMRNDIAKVELTALTANTDTTIDWNESDDKMVLVIQNSGNSEANLTIKAGNGIQGTVDHTLTIPTGTSLVKLESGRFKNVRGDKKGKIVVSATTVISVGTVALVWLNKKPIFLGGLFMQLRVLSSSTLLNCEGEIYEVGWN